jgi:hypothetical protein
LSCALLIGAPLLSSGSCVVVACSEDCDPCVSQCKCSNKCHDGTSQSQQALHLLDRYRLEERVDGLRRSVRAFTEIEGLSVQRAHGPAIPAEGDFARFAQGVLVVNARSFALSSGPRAWILDSAEMYETAAVVTFHQDTPSASNCVAFLFDRRGNLLEIDQTLAR